MKIYLAGPMRGKPNFNRAAFKAAADKLRGDGHEVYSPSDMSLLLFGERVGNNANGDEGEMGGDELTISRTVFHLDMTYICLQADAIALLPGWENSRGARAEKAAAEAIPLKIIYLENTDG